MPIFWIILVVFGALVILVPELLSLLVWLVLIFIWGNIILISSAMKKGKKESIKFWWYEIFKNKK